MRISGLGSGFDVGGTIAKLMEIEAKRAEKVAAEQEHNNEKITGWIDVKTNLTALTKASDTLRWMDVWRRMSTTSTDENVATATAASNAVTGSYSIEVSQLARAHTVATASGLADGVGDPVTTTTNLVDITGIQIGDQFAIAGQTFTITDTDTLLTLRDKINAQTADMPEDDQVSASILDNRLVLQRVNTGEGEIVLSDITGTSLNALGVLDGGGNVANELLGAQNAEFLLNGALITRSSNTGLTDVLQGVTLNLYGAGTSTLTIGKDTEAVKNAISEFVDAYNTAAEVMEFYGTWDRTDPSKPTPGLLQEDSMLREMIYSFRGLATQLMNVTHTTANAGYDYNGAQGVMNSLQHVGIWTEDEGNRLAIVDEDRLDTMLEQHFDKVENLFRGVPHETKAGVRVLGIAQTMYRRTRDYSSELDGWIDYKIEIIDDEVQRQEERIERIGREMEMKEAMLWRQFGAMDEAIGRMQSGFEYLMGQIGTPNSRQRN